MKIVVDVGHADGTGARGFGEEEHELCKVVGNYLADKLRKNGHEVSIVDFPEESNSSDLNKTVAAINSIKPDISVSLHADASDNAFAKGAHVCYYPTSQKGVMLAKSIAKEISEILPGRAETIKARSDLYVLRATSCVAVLVECGFITNKHDNALLKGYPNLIASAIVEGIENCKF